MVVIQKVLPNRHLNCILCIRQDFLTALLEINSTTSIAPILTPLPLPASLARWAKVSLDLEFEKPLVLLQQKSSALGSHNGAKHCMKHLAFDFSHKWVPRASNLLHLWYLQSWHYREFPNYKNSTNEDPTYV